MATEAKTLSPALFAAVVLAPAADPDALAEALAATLPEGTIMVGMEPAAEEEEAPMVAEEAAALAVERAAVATEATTELGAATAFS
jgi:hypothetical protein